MFDQFNNTRHVTQERITRIFKFAQSDDKFVEELVLGKDTLSDKSLLDYSSFDESGIYSPEFILARRKAMFSGFKYASVQSGLERAITHENDWKEVADGKFDLGAFVSFDKIGEYLLGGFLWQCIHTFLTFLSYLGGLGMLHVLIKKLLSNLNYTLPVKIKLKPQRVSQRRIHQERRMHFNWSDFGDDVETNGSSDSQRRFYQKRRSHFQDDVESNCSFDSDDNDVEKTDYDYDCDFEAPPPYYSDPTAPDL